jgi:hypothetical protein
MSVKFGRNEIARILQQEGFHISEGSVGNILRENKRQQKSSDVIVKQQQPQPQLKSNNNNTLETEATKESQLQANTTYTADDIIDTTGPPPFNPPHMGGGLPPANTKLELDSKNRNSGGLEPVLESKNQNKSSGSPLSFFIRTTTPVLTAKEGNSLLSPPPPPPSTSNVPSFNTLHEPVFSDSECTDDTLNLKMSEPTLIKDPELKQVNIAPDVSKGKNVPQDASFKEEDQEHPQQHQSIIALPDTTHTPRQTVEPETEIPQSSVIDSGQPVTVESSDTEINWDDDQMWHRRFFKSIMDEKRQRQRDLLIIQQEREELEVQKQQIAQFRYNIERQKTELDAREDKLVDILPLVPSCRELQAYGITFDLILPYLSFCHEKSVLQNMNMKDAAFAVAQTIRKYHQLEALERCIQQAEQHLMSSRDMWLTS